MAVRCPFVFIELSTDTLPDRCACEVRKNAVPHPTRFESGVAAACPGEGRRRSTTGRHLRLLTQWLAALLIGLASGCGYELPVEPTRVVVPPSNTPAAIQLLAGSRSSSVLDVAAKVTTADGRFLTGVAVTFSAVPGRVAPEVTVTDGAGLARAVLTTTGTSIVTATTGALSVSMALP